MGATFTPAHRGGSGPPLVCLHGFADTWRTWELVLPALERRHDVLALTLAGHAGGPPIEGEVSDAVLADAVERAMDEAGFETAHLVGQLARRLRGAPARRARARADGGRARACGRLGRGRRVVRGPARLQTVMLEFAKIAAPHAEAVACVAGGPAARDADTSPSNYEHIPTELLVHQLLGVAGCSAALPLIEYAAPRGLRASTRRGSPARCGSCGAPTDRLLPWPSAAARFRNEWLPHADWVELEGVGHCPQLDVPTETAQLILGFTN